MSFILSVKNVRSQDFSPLPFSTEVLIIPEFYFVTGDIKCKADKYQTGKNQKLLNSLPNILSRMIMINI
jgi:hypothetical protein